MSALELRIAQLERALAAQGSALAQAVRDSSELSSLRANMEELRCEAEAQQAALRAETAALRAETDALRALAATFSSNTAEQLEKLARDVAEQAEAADALRGGLTSHAYGLSALRAHTPSLDALPAALEELRATAQAHGLELRRLQWLELPAPPHPLDQLAICFSVVVEGRGQILVRARPDCNVAHLHAIIQAETGLPPSAQVLFVYGRQLLDAAASLGSCGVETGTLVRVYVSTTGS